jgi:hypothetical protein
MLPLLLPPAPVVYKGTINGLRVSAVDGTAFIDNLPYTYQSDFSAGVDGWTVYGGTNDGNIDSIGGLDNWLRHTLNNANDAHAMLRTSFLTIGKKYTISFKYYIPSGQTVVAGIKLVDSMGVAITGVTHQTTLDTATTYTVTFTAPRTGIQIRATNAAGGNDLIQDAGGDDVFYIKDITISEIQPYMDGNHSIEIYDSSNRMLRGVLKAAGSSETLGDELVTNGDNEAAVMSSENFRQTVTQSSEQAQAGTYSAKAVLSGGTDTHYGRWAIDRLKLYKFSGYFYLPSGQTVNRLAIGGDYKTEASFGISKFTTLTNQWINLSLYTTPYGTLSNHVTAGSLLQNNADEDYYYYDTFTIKQVLTPSTSGATIVSAKGGETYNFSYKNPSFTYNADSYYIIIKRLR